LLASAGYRNPAAVFEQTRPTGMSIGERRRSGPHGRPGFLGVDTVHQGDWEGAKWVYHINAVDAVTRWQVVDCASKISEVCLLPVLEAVLAQFPFVVLGFHVDNGSEYINHRVAKMLEKLHAEFTKAGPAAVRTTHWWRARTGPWCASSSVVDTSRAEHAPGRK
jgi:hypothetical protein